jgi:hypothetical protein
MNRDDLGRIVREAWCRWACAQPDPKPSWLVPWESLPESDREADRLIAEAVLAHTNSRRLDLCEKKSRDELTPAEAVEFAFLQEGWFSAWELLQPRDREILERLERIEKRLAGEGLS